MAVVRKIEVTDHAILRYLERVEGVDIERVRRIIARKTRVAIDQDGPTGVLSEGMRYCLQGEHVVTVIPVDWPAKARQRKR